VRRCSCQDIATWPWQSFGRTVVLMWQSTGDRLHQVQWGLELVTAPLLVLGVVLLVRAGLLAEAIYVGSASAALLTSTTYLSLPRSTLTAFPLFLLGARALARPGRRVAVVLTAAGCLAGTVATAWWHLYGEQVG
jgi:hypothetical protein